MKSLEEFFLNSSYKKEIYSEEGIFMIDKKNLYQVTYLDGEITKFPNYIDDINIITDKTEETKKIVNQVPFNNIVLDLETRHYVLNKQSKFKLVIDFIINDSKLEPHNFYFDTPNTIDINSPLFKEDLNVFLFHLN